MHDTAYERVANEDEVTFSQPALVPGEDPEYNGGRKNEFAEFGELADPFREAMQAIAILERTVQQRDHALLQSTIAAAELKQRLDEEKTQNQQLTKRLTATVTANELLTAKTVAEGRDPANRGRQIPEAEVALMKEQWRASQKLFERELARLRSEVVRATSEKQQLDIQVRAQRAETARASLQVANMERQVNSARETAAVATAANDDRGRWKLLSATSAGTAVLILAAGVAWQFSRSPHSVANPGETSPQQVASTSTSPPARLLPANTAPTSRLSPSTPFQALSRLNNSLSIPGGATPEQLLRAVRENNAKTDPGVCNFAWNNGQPALNYSGHKLSLEASLDQCAAAVDKFLRRQ